MVVNAVGIFRERGHQTFDLLHRRAPIALFEACARSTVRAVIQLSALGADAHATTAYHLSKRAADERLSALDVASAILQPSLVYGAGGVSAAFFGMLSTMPVAMLPDGGHQPVQPVHVDDVADTVARLATMPPDSTAWPRQRVAVVGPQPLTLRDYLQALRQSLGHGGRLHVLPVPASWMQLALPLAGLLSPGLSLDRDALAMLARGNAADAADTAAFAALLGRPPRAIAAFVPKPWREAARQQAVLGWQLPILRLAIALVWIITGIVSLGLYPVEQSHALLARAGVPASLRPLALYGAAVLDLVLGVLCLSRWRLRGGFPWVWAAQAALILGYTVIISVRLPEFWLHPYGPLTKNLPMLAALWLLGTLERKRWTT
ncbi:uncharacterized protein YbjT (DUF2867 family) [Cupriavidus gilardii J11]|uniref:Uncharacterized protein YbjT (DUF2867 family) n=1 Tax=Cupriavidus gilardii J11 TaxID=936133 RepID=A0A562B9F8_9BURK|nr:uncharacterized protein YbjT (DUF2867 family) [Cupriavidus gilardii J11]